MHESNRTCTLQRPGARHCHVLLDCHLKQQLLCFKVAGNLGASEQGQEIGEEDSEVEVLSWTHTTHVHLATSFEDPPNGRDLRKQIFNLDISAEVSGCGACQRFGGGERGHSP